MHALGNTFNGGQAGQGMLFQIDGWLVEPAANRIRHGEEAIHVEPKVMDVLVYLADRAGQTVTREALLEDVWADVSVSDDALNRCISQLRRLFDDDAREPRVIETITKSGYRLIAPVQRFPRQDQALQGPGGPLDDAETHQMHAGEMAPSWGILFRPPVSFRDQVAQTTVERIVTGALTETTWHAVVTEARYHFGVVGHTRHLDRVYAWEAALDRTGTEAQDPDARRAKQRIYLTARPLAARARQAQTMLRVVQRRRRVIADVIGPLFLLPLMGFVLASLLLWGSGLGWGTGLALVLAVTAGLWAIGWRTVKGKARERQESLRQLLDRLENILCD